MKKIRLGKNNYYLVQADGVTLEPTLKQFMLKVENKGDYDRIGTTPVFNNNYGMFITAETIKNRDGYAYISYEGKIYDFETAYKKALAIQLDYANRLEKFFNIFLYNGYAYFLDEKYLKKENRQCFKSIEDEMMDKKYRCGSHKHVKKGLEQSQALTQKILALKGK